jgi:hypothetical protein
MKSGWEHELKEKSENDLIKIIQDFNVRKLDPYKSKFILLEI